VTADGSNGVDLLNESHNREKNAPSVEHLITTQRERLQAITVGLHMCFYNDWSARIGELITLFHVCALRALKSVACPKKTSFGRAKTCKGSDQWTKPWLR
jgi:hypothetical protein